MPLPNALLRKAAPRPPPPAAVVVGQAKRSLGALIVPSQEALEAAGGDAGSAELRRTIQARVWQGWPAGCGPVWECAVRHLNLLRSGAV